MDVHCSTCDEPWDVHYLRYEAIFETDLRQEEAGAWIECSSQVRLLPRYRDEFRSAGWEFGGSIVNVIHCPCCPKGAQPNTEREKTKAGLERLFSDDDDGLAATFEDYNL